MAEEDLWGSIENKLYGGLFSPDFGLAATYVCGAEVVDDIIATAAKAAPASLQADVYARLFSPGFARDLYDATGPRGFKTFLKKVGRKVATRMHADRVRHNARDLSSVADGLQVPDEALDALAKRAVLLVDARDLDDADLKAAIEALPESAGGGQYSDEQYETLVARFEALLGKAKAVAGERDHYRQRAEGLEDELGNMFAELAGNPDYRRLGRQLSQMQDQLKKGAGDPEDRRKLEEAERKVSGLEAQISGLRGEVAARSAEVLAERAAKAEVTSTLEEQRARYRSLDERLRRVDRARERALEASTANAGRADDEKARADGLQRSYNQLEEQHGHASALVTNLSGERGVALAQVARVLEHLRDAHGYDDEAIAALGIDATNSHQRRILEIEARLTSRSDDVLLYQQLLYEGIELGGGEIVDQNRLIITRAVENLARLDSLGTLCTMAESYRASGSLQYAETLTAQVYWHSTIEDAQTYRLLADVVDESNTSGDDGRAGWAHEIRGRAQEIHTREELARYNTMVEADADSIEGWLGVVSTLMHATGGNIGGDQENYALYALFRLGELDAVEEVVGLAQGYRDWGQGQPAEFCLSKLVSDGVANAAVYGLLADVVETSDSHAHDAGRQEWARYLRHEQSQLVQEEELQTLRTAASEQPSNADRQLAVIDAYVTNGRFAGDGADYVRAAVGNLIVSGDVSRIAGVAFYHQEQGRHDIVEALLTPVFSTGVDHRDSYLILAGSVRAIDGTPGQPSFNPDRLEYANFINFKADELQTT